MVQSNPLCRLETADTTEERRIAALSNRCLSLLLYTILSFREKSKSMFWSKRKEVTRLSPFTGHTCCSLKFLQLSLSRPNLDPHQSSCPELKSDNFWTHFFPSRPKTCRWDKISSRVEVLRRRVEQMVGPMSEEMISGNAKRAVGSGGTGEDLI